MNDVVKEAIAYGAHGDLGKAASPEVQAKLLEQGAQGGPSPEKSPKKPRVERNRLIKRGSTVIAVAQNTFANAGYHIVVTAENLPPAPNAYMLNNEEMILKFGAKALVPKFYNYNEVRLQTCNPYHDVHVHHCM